MLLDKNNAPFTIGLIITYFGKAIHTSFQQNPATKLFF